MKKKDVLGMFLMLVIFIFALPYFFMFLEVAKLPAYLIGPAVVLWMMANEINKNVESRALGMSMICSMLAGGIAILSASPEAEFSTWKLVSYSGLLLVSICGIYWRRTFVAEEVTIIGNRIFLPGERVNAFFTLIHDVHQGNSISLGCMSVGKMYVKPNEVEIDAAKLSKDKLPFVTVQQLAEAAKEYVRSKLHVETNGAVGVQSPGSHDFEILGIPMKWNGKAFYSFTL